MGMFDELCFAPEIGVKYGLTLNHTYQTKDLLDDDSWEVGVRHYRVQADGRLVRVEREFFRTADDNNVLEYENVESQDVDGEITFCGEWDPRIRNSELRWYAAEISHGVVTAVRDLNRPRVSFECGLIE